MNAALYNTTIDCPVCRNKFDVTKVKSKTSKVVSRDPDFCIHYEGINPLLYDAWVCENCGYAALQDKFGAISDKDVETILQNITPRWNKRSFAGERSIEIALEAFKIALFNLQLRKAKASDIAKVCLRIAWLYRIKKDEKEKEFLSFALKNYNEAYEKEVFPVDKLDEHTCVYMIAELNRLVENYEEALKWFGRLISSPQARLNEKLIQSAREQVQAIRRQMGK
ncbi:MAG: DUF2225 domain-containing protein [Clostridia bacterium]|nr:DUF2225 domain-containing protein [Clostridia bacterium]